MKRVAIIQSSYIPWKGYFDIINSVDEFILLDDVQYTRRDWRNRNLIKTPQGVKWLTIPVHSKGFYQANINEITTAGTVWTTQHWNTITCHYARAPFFHYYEKHFRDLYMHHEECQLSRINYSFIRAISELLNIKTKLSWSSDYSVDGHKTQKLLGLCKASGADVYLSGPSAKAYLEEGMFHSEGIGVEWMDYSGYPEYHQLFPPFEHRVSILDLLFNEGPNAARFLKSYSL